MSNLSITEINKDIFWALIDQAKTYCGQDQDACLQWLEDRLTALGPEQALRFDAFVHGYRELAYKYGLWSAASIMCDGCSDDGFTDFRAWLIAQGRKVYMAALKDPDSLADMRLLTKSHRRGRDHGSVSYQERTGGSFGRVHTAGRLHARRPRRRENAG